MQQEGSLVAVSHHACTQNRMMCHDDTVITEGHRRVMICLLWTLIGSISQHCSLLPQACAYGSIPVLMTFDADVLHINKIKLRGVIWRGP